jgi:protocatechuate 3,4-dioxygenase, alpha subunit
MIPTPSQTVGPFFGFALPFPSDADAVPTGSPGAIRIEGQLLDGAGEPVPGGMLEAWHADQFARCGTDSEGAFHFTVRKPEGRGDEAPHLEIAVFGRGLLRHLMTRIYFPDEEEANASDQVLQQVEAGRRQTLIGRPDGGALHFDVRLQGENETVFFAL